MAVKSSWTRERLVGDPVADPGERLDRRGLSELAAQAAERDVDRVGERVDELVPHLAEEVFGAQDAVLSAHQRLQQRELLGGEVELPSRARDGVVERVELDPRGAKDPGGRRGPAARERADA